MDITSSLIFIMGGLFFGAILFWMIGSERKFFQKAILLQGVITGVATTRDKNNSTLYAPVVSFEFEDQPRQVTGNTYTNKKPKIGDPCWVGVDPENPDDARIPDSKGMKAFLILMLSLCGIMILFGISGFFW